MKQRTEEWFEARRGKVTASRIADVMAKTKSGYGAGRKNYMAELLVERLTGITEESYISAPMQWGMDHEDEARATYEFEKDVIVEEMGFVPHPSIADSGASPDGRVGSVGLVEIKCPNTATHIETLLTMKVDRKYLLQMQWQMVCADMLWCDFVSYDPRLVGHEIFVTRISRDPMLIEEIEAEVTKFLHELAEMEAKVRAL